MPSWQIATPQGHCVADAQVMLLPREFLKYCYITIATVLFLGFRYGDKSRWDREHASHNISLNPSRT